MLGRSASVLQSFVPFLLSASFQSGQLICIQVTRCCFPLLLDVGFSPDSKSSVILCWRPAATGKVLPLDDRGHFFHVSCLPLSFDPIASFLTRYQATSYTNSTRQAATICTKKEVHCSEDMQGKSCGAWPAIRPRRSTAPSAKTRNFAFGTYTPKGALRVEDEN